MITVTLGEFTRSGLERHLGHDLAAGVRIAAAHYAARLRSGRAPLPPASFLPGLNTPSGGVQVELTLLREDSAVLEREAERLGVKPGRLLVHAVLAYLAEIERRDIAPPAAEPCETGRAR